MQHTYSNLSAVARYQLNSLTMCGSGGQRLRCRQYLLNDTMEDWVNEPEPFPTLLSAQSKN